jgi:hypothetical protein
LNLLNKLSIQITEISNFFEEELLFGNRHLDLYNHFELETFINKLNLFNETAIPNLIDYTLTTTNYLPLESKSF